MKKIIVFMLSLMLIITPAFAETAQLSDMNEDELISLYQQIELMLGINGEDRIGRGSYVVGKDIQAGCYDFLCLDTDYFQYDGGENKPDNDIIVYTLNSSNPSDTGEKIFWEQRFTVGAHVVINLKEGTLLEISGCSGYLKKIEPSWAP